ncbi:MAG: CpXC domain-containing protein [Myxococcota bacterium]|nr:CpXC domain-containing protein [Myxococcota bacterium]
MSTFVPSTIICPCGEHYVVEVANGLHISLRPDVRQQLLDGTFHRFSCPACARTTMLDALLAFTDFPRRQWFTIAPSTGLPWRRRWLAIAERGFETTMVTHAPALVVDMSRDMTRRLMFGLAALREKLITFDAGLDDRVIELLKIQLIRDLRGTFSPADYFHLVEVGDAELRFEKTHADGIIRPIAVPRPMYAALAAHPDIEAMIQQAFPEGVLFDHRAILAPHATDDSPTPGA